MYLIQGQTAQISVSCNAGDLAVSAAFINAISSILVAQDNQQISGADALITVTDTTLIAVSDPVQATATCLHSG